MEKEKKDLLEVKRKLDPEDINLPEGYEIEVFKEGLTTPINIIFTDEDEMLVADAGVTSGNGKVLKLTSHGFEVIAEGFNPPLTGITYHEGNIYVSHRGYITIIKPDGTKENIIEGLPSWGDHHNNRVVFGHDGKMYFGQGTATNSGVVGMDNSSWVKRHPFFHDYPGSTVMLLGKNYKTENFLTKAQRDSACTGSYSPFGVPSYSGEIVKGVVKASGSVLRANPDGSDLELVAWGLRNPFRMKFDRNGCLFSTDHGMDVRGSRPVANSPDSFYVIKYGAWYGWPDYTGGLPVTLPIFKPENEPQPSFLLAQHPMEPPKPLAIFEPHSAIMGFDFNYNPLFGEVGDVYIAEFGSEAPRTTGGKPMPYVGHRISKIDMETGKVSTFAINKSFGAASYTDGGGLERPIDVVFGPDDCMYVADFGMMDHDHANGYHGFIPNTGVIWRITKK
ncbi:PQQ-dependent sugar dehydrogenase [Thermohalobacter berrensis]|uniref:Uncharacterized protein n=1 Tax=Thermohalobacter berrensis TaxID=99594 RepID=A0A419SXQ3_9FIRM|nr:PQQ-dependent sugar dehydrogenase [Thermohalobacter berrensis]RKD30042.1 hypothetical protein BET03_04880 [Thermohalobacter berrensis]